jgi:DNA-directed RNA polymerase subunit F
MPKKRTFQEVSGEEDADANQSHGVVSTLADVCPRITAELMTTTLHLSALQTAADDLKTCLDIVNAMVKNG